MRIQALAVDFDGTIARHGQVAGPTRAAMAAVRASGRRLFLVTGRMLDQLLQTYPSPADFDLIVAENGAVLYDPATTETVLLGEEPPPALLEELERLNVPCNRGRIIVETREPHEVGVLRAIRRLGIEWDLTFNKGAVMALPAGIDKASGLEAALERFKLSVHNVAGIGDAENDHNFLRVCEVAAATGNALPAIKERADLVMRRRNGRGVVEFIEEHVLRDLAGAFDVLSRHTVHLGTLANGEPLLAPVHGANMLVLGAPGSGTPALVDVLVERLTDAGYQVCLIGTEGKQAPPDPLVMIGGASARPTLKEVDLALKRAPAGIAVNLGSFSRADRVRFSSELLSTIVAMRAVYGRPHWLVVNEAHDLLPGDGPLGRCIVPEGLDGLCLVTTRADLLARPVLERVTHLFAVGGNAGEQVAGFGRVMGLHLPVAPSAMPSLMQGEALTARVENGTLRRPRRFRVASRRTRPRLRVHGYADGDLNDGSFYFRGADGRLNLRASSVSVFVELGHGIDLDTWRYHLERGDYSTWFRQSIKDHGLADAIDALVREGRSNQEALRERILRLVRSGYAAGG